MNHDKCSAAITVVVVFFYLAFRGCSGCHDVVDVAISKIHWMMLQMPIFKTTYFVIFFSYVGTNPN